MPALGGKLSREDIITRAEQEAAKAAEKKEKADQAAAKQSWNLMDALANLAAQALSSSNSMKELGDNLARAGVNFLAQMANQMVGGPMGTLLGGLIQFGGNLLLNKESPLPIRDGALETRIVNFHEMNLQYAGVRDRGELAYSRKRREEWSSASRGG
jgi:chemotaxis protein histidine kinase CheA